MTKRFSYPTSVLFADYGRAAGGALLTGLPLVLVEPLPVVRWILIGLCVLFIVFGLRTLVRQLSVVELSDSHIATIGPGGRKIAWNAVTKVKLRYYSTRRKKADGWMQLKIWNDGTSIAIDSSMDGFHEVADYTAKAIRDQGVRTDETTASNFAGLGLQCAVPEA